MRRTLHQANSFDRFASDTQGDFETEIEQLIACWAMLIPNSHLGLPISSEAKKASSPLDTLLLIIAVRGALLIQNILPGVLDLVKKL